MKSEDYVNQVAAANRKLFKAEKMTISPISMKDQLRMAFEAGYQEGLQQGLREEHSKKSLWESIFGRL